MKFLGKEHQSEREEFVFEESKEKPKAKSYPHVSFGRFKNAKDQQVLLSEFSGPMRLGAREAKVNISFSYLARTDSRRTSWRVISDKEPAAPNPSSVSPDKKWEYNCGEYGRGDCYPEIVKAGTTERALDLDQELDVYGPDSRDAEVLWAPDSKRFAFNYSPTHAHYYVWITVAFYELRGEQWVALPSLLKESERSQVVQLAKEQLPKKLRGRREAARRDILKIRRWIDRDTAILYAYSVWDDAAKAAFLFTVKFDAGGKPKIVKTERLPEKEAEKEQ
jgi:hypothetical protein